MKRSVFAVSILMVLLMTACNGGKKAKSGTAAKDSENDSTLQIKDNYPGGGLKSVKNGKKVTVDGKTKYILDGEALEYYKVPANALASKCIYKDGKREGTYYKYYTNGKVYYEVPYVNGKKEGIKKIYFEDGKLMAEIPYKRSLIGVGTKEYTTKGILLDSPELKVWYKKSSTVNAVTVYAEVKVKGKITKRVKFYEGFLIDGKYYHKNLHEMKMGSNGVAQTTINNPMSHIVISADVRSGRDVHHFVTKAIDL